MESLEKAKLIEEAMDSLKARSIKIMDVGKNTSIAEYFVICSCSSGTQVRAAADKVEEEMKKAGFDPHHIEGYRGQTWILLDFGDVIAHVMTDETREFYDIERLYEE